ncbi:hypothetical protein N0V88_004629 [Collariella sp. IMI 366227]|nr:hypothetical protein N0V88_004629 [Collariella sp. IMI 366227]
MDPITKINYTSPWGGAHNRWVPPHPSLPPSLYRERIEYLEQPGPEYLALSTPPTPTPSPPGFRLLKTSEFPADGKVTWGCEYDTWCVNPMVYCAFLLRRFVQKGEGS